MGKIKQSLQEALKLLLEREKESEALINEVDNLRNIEANTSSKIMLIQSKWFMHQGILNPLEKNVETFSHDIHKQ